MQPSLFVKGFPPQASQQELKSFFQKVGEVRSVKIVKNFAFINYQSLRDAEKAVSKFHDKPFYGQKRGMLVELTKPKGRSEFRKTDNFRPFQNRGCLICKKQGHRKINCPELKKQIDGHRPRQWRKRNPSEQKYSKNRRNQSSDSSDSESRRSKIKKNKKKNVKSSSKSSRSQSNSSSSSRSKSKKHHSKKDKKKQRRSKNQHSPQNNRKKNKKKNKQSKRKQTKSNKKYYESSNSRSISRQSQVSKKQRNDKKKYYVQKVPRSTYSDSDKSPRKDKKQYVKHDSKDKISHIAVDRCQKPEEKYQKNNISKSSILSRSNSSMSR